MKSLVGKTPLVLWLCVFFCSSGQADNDRLTDSYLHSVAQKSVKAYFQIPGWHACVVSESFILHNDGTVSQIAILSHPTHFKTRKTAPAADKALVFAVKNAAPFPPPPSDLHCPIKLTLTIDGTDLDKPLKAKVNVGKTRF